MRAKVANPKQSAVTAISAAQQKLLEAADILTSQNKLARHLPEYQELQQTVTRLQNLSRAVNKLDL